MRGFAALAPLFLFGCATVPSAPDSETTGKLQAMMARQTALERKLELLEARLAASARPAKAAPRETLDVAVSGQTKTASFTAVPKNLAQVKVGPEVKRAPPLPTGVTLKEPDPEAYAEIMVGGDGGDEQRPSAATKGADKDEFEAAMLAIRTGDIESGASRLEAFADKNPQAEKAPVALYNAGLGRQNSGDLLGAVISYSRVSEDYPKSDEAAEAMLRMATCQLKMKKTAAARSIFASLVQRYPSTRAAQSAEAELKELARNSEGKEKN